MHNPGTLFDSVPEFEFVRDLEQFEGPILTELRIKGGARFVEKWCDLDGDLVRTLVVRSDQRSIAEYLAGRKSLFDLLVGPSADVGLLLDRRLGETAAGHLVQVSKLPPEYLPSAGAMHDPTLRPRWRTETQVFLLDQTWDAKLLSQLERNYQQVFAFCYFTHEDQDTATVPVTPLTYVYDSGYSYWRAFDSLYRRLPANDQPRAVGVEAASPGSLSIAAPAEAARRVNEAVEAAAADSTVKAYEALHGWSRLKHDKASHTPKTAATDLKQLCRTLSVDEERLFAGQETLDLADSQQLLVAGKLVAAYYRRLWGLISPEGGAEYLLPGAVTRAVTAPTSIYEYDDE
jgi:hypothetical protein